LGNTVTHIGENAFSGYTGITSISIPNLVTDISASAFKNCSGATHLSFGTNNVLKTIGVSAFSGCDSITSISIPDNVTDINASAFENCSGATRLTLGTGIVNIGAGAFTSCTSITSIDYDATSAYLRGFASSTYFSSEILALMSYAVKFNTSDDTILTQAEVNGQLSNLETSIDVTFEDGPNNTVKVIDTNAFGSLATRVKTIVIPDSVTSIGANAFRGCVNARNITIGANVKTIGDRAFENCSGITDLTIGESVRSIGNGAFSGCDSITSISIPDSVTSIGNGAFDGCVNATSITIGASVRSIGEAAFSGCVNVSNTITLLDQKLTSIGASAFYNTGTFGISTIDLSGSSAVTIGASAFHGVRISNVTFPLSITIGQDAFRTFKMLSTITFQRNSTSIDISGIEQFAFIEPLSEGGDCSINLPSSIYLASLASGLNETNTYPSHLSTKSPNYVRRNYHMYLDELSSSAGPITTSQNGLLQPMLSAGQVTNGWYDNVSMPVMTGASITPPDGDPDTTPIDRAWLALNPGYTVIETASPTNPNGALSSSTYDPPDDLYYVHDNKEGTEPALFSVNNSILTVTGVHFIVFFNNQLIRAIPDPD